MSSEACKCPAALLASCIPSMATRVPYSVPGHTGALVLPCQPLALGQDCCPSLQPVPLQAWPAPTDFQDPTQSSLLQGSRRFSDPLQPGSRSRGPPSMAPQLLPRGSVPLLSLPTCIVQHDHHLKGNHPPPSTQSLRVK